MTVQRGHAATPPLCVKGRKGGISVADCLVRALWSTDRDYDEWPSKSFDQLQAEVSRSAGYPVSPSTIRSTIYGHPELFIRARKEQRVLWKLTEGMM